MKKLVLIGGGDVGRGNTSYETDVIDRKIVELTNKANPNFLFIGLASSFSDSYYDTMKKIYSVPARYIFEGTFKVEVESSEEAKCYAKS